MGKIHVRNLFMLRECLIIVLEVSRYDLDALQIERMQNFIRKLSMGHMTTPLHLPVDLSLDLLECLQIFRKSSSRRWIRKEIQDMIHQLEKCLVNTW